MSYEDFTPVIRLGGGLAPSGSGTFPVAKASDILMPDNTRLDEYLENMGSGDSIPIVKVDSTSITLGELITILRNQGVTANDVCLVVIGNLHHTFVKIGDANTTSNTTKIFLWVDLSNPINYGSIMRSLPLSTTLVEIYLNANKQLETESKNLIGAINELNDKISDVSGGDPTTVWQINDEPDLAGLPFIYETIISCSFTSNGASFDGIGKLTTGSDSWGIHTLVYRSNGASISAYTNNPSGSYGIRHGWYNDAYKTITIQEPITDITLYTWLMANATLISGEVSIPCQPSIDVNLKTNDKTIVGAINEIYESGGSATTDAMPTIRFVGLKDSNLLYKTPDGESYSLRFSIEIVSGSLQVGDTLQICGMRTFGKSNANPYKKRKLRRFVEREITVDDLDYRYLLITVEPTKNAFAHLGHNNRIGNGGPVTVYFRVRRPEGQLQANNSGMTVSAKYSNVVPVSIMYTSILVGHPDGEYEMLRINVL